MNPKANVAIQTLHGVFVQSLFSGDGERAFCQFANLPDIRMELPDDGVYLKGPQEIKDYLVSLAGFTDLGDIAHPGHLR